jgi:hypothetical protein
METIAINEPIAAIDQLGDEILVTSASGRRWRIWHEQDCCESASLESTDGDLSSLVGKCVEIDHDAEPMGDPPPQYPESWTRTKITFRADGDTVVTRWLVESNGYYGEEISISELVDRQPIRD